MNNNKEIFIAWIDFQRRAVSMQSFFNYKLVFYKNLIKNPHLRIFDYLWKSIITTFTLLKYRPKVLWVQLPPAPLLIIARFYKFCYKRSFLIADCHNAIISDKWINFFRNNRSLLHFDLILVHNDEIYNRILDLGIDKQKVRILEDRPAEKMINGNWMESKNQILMPCSFSYDEPLETVFKAAKKIPEINIYLTGPMESAKISKYSIPSNVILTGYLSVKEYEKIFMESNAILGLTTEDHIQLSVANEAVGFGKPMILSNTKLLKKLFYKGAVYVDTLSPNSIVEGIKIALNDQSKLKEEILQLKSERTKDWMIHARKIKSLTP